MSSWIAFGLLGIGAGSAYALTALGLIVVYRSSGVVNFASGAIGMGGMYLFYELTVTSGWPWVPAAILGVLASALLGVATYGVLSLARNPSHLTQVIGTLAVLLILQALAQLHYANEQLFPHQFLPGGIIDFGGNITLATERAVLFGVAVVLTLVLAFVYQRSRFGLASTAVSESPRNLAALGWRVSRLRAANWAVGGALAGLAGILLTPITGIVFSSGTTLLVPVLAAALVGGFTSFRWTLVGGLVIGILQSEFTQHSFGVPGAADIVPFLVIILVLIVRGRALPLRNFVGERLPAIGTGRIPLIPLGIAIVVGWVLVGGASEDWASAVTVTAAAAVVCLSLVVVLGYAGQLSLAQVALAGVGTLIAARASADLHLPFILTFVAAMVGTVPLGVLVGVPSTRTRGISLAIITLGLAVAINSLLFANPSITGGSNGIQTTKDGKISLFGWQIDTLFHAQRFALVSLGVFAIVAIAVVNLRRGRAGRRLVAVRSNERAAASLGISVAGAKLWAFGIGAAIAAIAGTLVAFQFQAALFTEYSVFQNITVVAYSVIGGVGSPVGALVGGTFEPGGVGTSLLGEVSSGWAEYIYLVGGVLLLLTVIINPDGIAVSWSKFLHKIVDRLPLVISSRRSLGAATRALSADGEKKQERVAAKGLEVSEIHVAFDGVVAVDGVSLSVAPGEVVGLIGPNGAGKTTFIDAVTGFQGGGGSVSLGGDLVPTGASRRARLGMSRSFQSLELFEDLTVFDNLRAAADPRDSASYVVDMVHPDRGQLTPATLAAIETCSLGSDLARFPSELSFGARRLVALARSVASEPSVLLLDEPCAGLSTQERSEVAALIRQLAEERGMGVLLVEHDVQMVRSVSDRVVVLEFGRVIATGPPDEVLSDPAVIKAYVGDLDPDSVPEPAGEGAV